MLNNIIFRYSNYKRSHPLYFIILYLIIYYFYNNLLSFIYQGFTNIQIHLDICTYNKYCYNDIYSIIKMTSNKRINNKKVKLIELKREILHCFIMFYNCNNYREIN